MNRRRILVGVLLLAALAIGAFVVKLLPDPDEVGARPFVHQARLGEGVDTRVGRFTATGPLRGTKAVSSYGKPITTTGTYLVLTVEFTATGKPRGVSWPAIVAADGTRFGGGQPAGGVNGCVSQPGITQVCTWSFELDSAKLAGAHLEVFASGMPTGAAPGGADDLVDVDLGITEQQAAELARSTAPIQLPLSKPKGAG